MDLAGIYCAMTTPYAADGTVSCEDIRFNVERYNGTGLAGYVVLGSTGESVMLSRKEADEVLVTAREAVGPGKRLLAGTGAESTAETIERTKRAAKLGYDAALVKTPYYYKPAYKPVVLVEHYRRVADASPIPVLLYSVPQFTGVTLEAPEVAELAGHPNIIGIKDSSGHVQRVGEIVGLAPKNFQVLVGSAGTIYPSFVSGACGAILALACALPDSCVELRQLILSGRHAEAARLQAQVLRASKAIVSDGSIAGVKYAMEQNGYRGGLPRPPLPALSEPQAARIREALVPFIEAKARTIAQR